MEMAFLNYVFCLNPHELFFENIIIALGFVEQVETIIFLLQSFTYRCRSDDRYPTFAGNVPETTE